MEIVPEPTSPHLGPTPGVYTPPQSSDELTKPLLSKYMLDGLFQRA
jgi:hypothetical protein